MKNSLLLAIFAFSFSCAMQAMQSGESSSSARSAAITEPLFTEKEKAQLLLTEEQKTKAKKTIQEFEKGREESKKAEDFHTALGCDLHIQLLRLALQSDENIGAEIAQMERDRAKRVQNDQKQVSS